MTLLIREKSNLVLTCFYYEFVFSIISTGVVTLGFTSSHCFMPFNT